MDGNCLAFSQLRYYFTQQIVNKLLCRAPGQAAVRQLPFICLQKEFLLGHLHMMARRQHTDNILKLPGGGRTEIDRHAETGHQGQLLLNGIGGVKLFIGAHIMLVTEGLSNQMTAVGGGVKIINQ